MWLWVYPFFKGFFMGQKKALSKSFGVSGVFVELHIEDLVKERLLWQEQFGRRAYPRDNLPSVIHILGSSLTPLR
jgi:hypothetical protein